ncbi:MAG TPA: TrmH family RNA methyltransferase [Solirubrobacteraceae bacterium]|nr:TrmH family RNA methyltransferase [Solirubrobacteraceae bacterium]
MGDDGLAAQVGRLRADPRMALLEGFHALKHALRFRACIELAVAADLGAVDALAGEMAPDLRPALRRLVREADPDVMALAAPRIPHTGVVGFARRPQDGPDRLRKAPRDKPVVLLENPRDLGNVGAVIRVAAAADAAAVLTTGDRDPWDPRAIRGSAGLHFALPVLRSPPGPVADRPLVAVDPEGESLGAEIIPPGAVLAFGTERHGLTDDVLDRAAMRLRIPMRPGVSSLNLATAVAVVLFALRPPGEPPGPRLSGGGYG